MRTLPHRNRMAVRGRIVLVAGRQLLVPTVAFWNRKKQAPNFKSAASSFFWLLSSSMPCLLPSSLLSSSLLSHVLVLPSPLASVCNLLVSFVCSFFLPLGTSRFLPLFSSSISCLLSYLLLQLAFSFCLLLSLSLLPLQLLSSSRSCFLSCLLLRLAFFFRLLILPSILLAFRLSSASFSCLLRLLAGDLLALAACLLLPQAHSCFLLPDLATNPISHNNRWLPSFVHFFLLPFAYSCLQPACSFVCFSCLLSFELAILLALVAGLLLSSALPLASCLFLLLLALHANILVLPLYGVASLVRFPWFLAVGGLCCLRLTVCKSCGFSGGIAILLKIHGGDLALVRCILCVLCAIDVDPAPWICTP